MFDQLMESRPMRTRSTTQMLLSVAAHTVVIAVSIQLTRAAAATIEKRPAATEMLLTRPPTPRPSITPSTSRSAVSVPAPALALPAPPITIPTNIPPVVLDTKLYASQFLSKGARSIGVPDGTPDLITADTQFVASLAQAEDPAQYLSGPAPAYPPALRTLGIEGSVQLRYIVGVDGRAEPGSITVSRSTNRAFEEPAADAVRLAKFRPAKIRGRVVRQLVEQVVRFTLGAHG